MKKTIGMWVFGVLWFAFGAVGVGSVGGRWYLERRLLVDPSLSARVHARSVRAPQSSCSGLDQLTASGIEERMRASGMATPESFVAECITGQPRAQRASILGALIVAAAGGDTLAERLVEASARDACATILALQQSEGAVTEELVASCAIVARPETARLTTTEHAQLVRLRWSADLALIMAGIATPEVVTRWCAAWPSIDPQVARHLRAVFPDVDEQFTSLCATHADAMGDGGTFE